jgi:hypothetical protein
MRSLCENATLAEIGDQPLQPPFLVLELPHPPQLALAQVGELLPPGAERRLTDPHLPTDIAYR